MSDKNIRPYLTAPVVILEIVGNDTRIFYYIDENCKESANYLTPSEEELLKEYLDQDRYVVLNCDRNNSQIFIKKETLNSINCELLFTECADIYFNNRALCYISLAAVNRKDFLTFLKNYSYKIWEPAILNIRKYCETTLKQFQNAASPSDIDLFSFCKYKNDFTEFDLLLEVI